MARKPTKRELMRKESNKKRRAAWAPTEEVVQLCPGSQDEETPLGKDNSMLTVVNAATGATILQRLPTASMRSHRRVIALAKEGRTVCNDLWEAVVRSGKKDVIFYERTKKNAKKQGGSQSLAVGLMRYAAGRGKNVSAKWGWAMAHEVAPVEAAAMLRWLKAFVELTVETHFRQDRIAEDFAARIKAREALRGVMQHALGVDGANQVHQYFHTREVIQGITGGFHLDPHDDVPNILINLGSAVELQLAEYGKVHMNVATVVLFNNRELHHAASRL
ncbi:hypothetical protein CBOM_01215 [Ceraceosorus bombacis]|uniref:Uncharacterized protein n=1 Tax=Ceraceosorus bombacis TaxID=401625 RepID=A0A0P1BD37_9BASI|nr:hypothetical protein CBOM_01215 [Ceraceosorus bombacis]